jgi:hypothetical protein
MPGYLVHVGATVMCAHAGQAQPTVPNPRVKVGGQPVVTMSAPYSIAGCGLTGSTLPPCVTGQWLVAATRVKVGGTPVVLQDSTSTCVPTGTPMSVVVTQVRVKGT